MSLKQPFFPLRKRFNIILHENLLLILDAKVLICIPKWKKGCVFFIWGKEIDHTNSQFVEGMPNLPYVYAMDFLEVLKKKHASGTYKKMVRRILPS